MLSERENLLRTIRFQYPDWIPCRVALSGAIWKRHREALEEVVLDHPFIFGRYQRSQSGFDDFGPAYRKGEVVRDNWGCIWENASDGIRGQVKYHPLSDWKKLESYSPPNPLTQTELGPREPWEKTRRLLEKRRERGEITWGQGDRFFERLHFLRGYKNLMIDLLREPPELQELIQMVEDHNTRLIRKWLTLGVDGIVMGDDLGAQRRSMMSSRVFRRHLYPSYARMAGLVRKAGGEVYFHSDGHIIELLPDLMRAGFTVLNPQISCNPMKELISICKGKVCLDADLDRQHILPRGSPERVRKHVEHIVRSLGSKEGGLMMIAGIYGDVPLKNIEALCEAMEEFRFHFS